MITELLRIVGNLRYINSLSHSYSQSAEDVIVNRTLNKMGISRANYLDIGCNHPIILNNTYLLYKQGGEGILVDANPNLAHKIRKLRKRDKFVNVGIDDKSNQSLNFYTLSDSALSTFDENMVSKIVQNGKIKILKEQKIPIIGINDFLNQYYCKNTHFVSLDVEGFDARILNSWDFKKFRPLIFCVETISHQASNHEQTKVIDILRIFNREGYITFADTFINTIFVDKNNWYNRENLYKM